MMQENHSFDNYLGVLPYVGGPYHPPVGQSCGASDHKCVDGLTCRFDAHNNLQCMNNNIDDDGSTVLSFHETKFCTGPDLDHEWPGSHREANLNHPTETILSSPNDGFVVQNDTTEQIDNGVESPTDDDTMGYYNQDDLPFYYKLAQTFSMDDRYCSVRPFPIAATLMPQPRSGTWTRTRALFYRVTSRLPVLYLTCSMSIT